MAWTYWMHGFGGDKPKETAHALKAMGFGRVVAGGAAVIKAVAEAGMRPWVCGGAFGLGDLKDDDSVKAVSITGDRQVWFNSGCPNCQVLRDRNLDAYRKMATTPDIEGILVDGCRFASPASGLDAFLTCFCKTCRDKAHALGCDFDAMKRDVARLRATLVEPPSGARTSSWLETPIGLVEWLVEYPGVLEWLRFRRLCATEHFRAVGEVIHGAGLRMGVYIFTPSLAPLVGQSYVDLCEFVDVFAPMIYRNYPKRRGEACLNWELTIIPEELGRTNPETMRFILAWTGLDAVIPEGTFEGIREALPPEAVGHETALARALIGEEKELAPIIYIDDPLIARTAAQVRANGANGVNFFVFREGWEELVRPAFTS